jgi:pilus assembly protein Flp/PilA
MLNIVKNLILAEEGQGMTEYGLVLGAIAIGVVAVLALLREQIVGLFTKVTTELKSAGGITTP